MNLGHYIKNENPSVYRWKYNKIKLNFGKGSSPAPPNHWMETLNL